MSKPRQGSGQYHIEATRRRHCISTLVAGGCAGRALFGRIGSGSEICMWLTFCCLHSLQAFRLPPRRLPVTGGVFSISPDSGLLCVNSTPEGGRGSLADRKSLGGIKGGPFGASRCRYCRSIKIGLCSPDIKPHETRPGAPECSSAGNRRNRRRWKGGQPVVVELTSKQRRR